MFPECFIFIYQIEVYWAVRIIMVSHVSFHHTSVKDSISNSIPLV